MLKLNCAAMQMTQTEQERNENNMSETMSISWVHTEEKQTDILQWSVVSDH